MHSAFILCAGFGTRLRPLTRCRPKPLMPVLGVPLLAYSLALLKKHGLRSAVINSHHLAEQLTAWQGVHEGVQVSVVREQPDVLGTGGGLKAVADQLSSPVLVLNGDILTDVDLSALLNTLPVHGATMALRSAPKQQYGAVRVDSDGAIVQLRDFSAAHPRAPLSESTHFTGVHALHPSILNELKDGFSCIVGDRYMALAKEGQLKGYLHDGLWLDIGAPEHYLNANLKLLKEADTLPLNPFKRAAWARNSAREFGDFNAVGDATLLGCAWIGHSTRLHNALIQNSVVGHGATLTEGCTLVDCVVWDGATVPPGQWRRTIFFDGGQLGPIG